MFHLCFYGGIFSTLNNIDNIFLSYTIPYYNSNIVVDKYYIITYTPFLLLFLGPNLF